MPLLSVLDRLALLFLVVLPLLRPLIWSGEAADLPNLLYLMLLAAGSSVGLLCRALSPVRTGAACLQGGSRPAGTLAFWLGLAAFAWLGLAACRSEVPGTAWPLYLDWTLHALAVWALLPQLRRRPELALAALAAGAFLSVGMLVGQALWVRPVQYAEALKNPEMFGADAWTQGQLMARVSTWRLEGNFLLCNTLAAYLLLIIPLALTLAWRSRSLWAAALSLALLGGLAATGCKAGILCLGLGAAAGLLLWAKRSGRAWWWTVPLVLAALLGAVCLIPALGERAAASLGERFGYWQAAWAAWWQAPLFGHGLEGFRVLYTAVKPPLTEPTTYAHQETLQLLVDS